MIRLSDEARQHIALFEDVTDVAARDCIVARDDAEPRVVFVVPPEGMADAIGPGGRTVSTLEERLGTAVELVEDADTPDTFVANALRPAAVYDVTVRERERDGEPETVAYAAVDAADFGAAIGAGGKNVAMATRLAERHHGVDAIELVPDPDSALDAVADVTGVEPVDVLFDPEDERLLVLVPSGTADTVAGASDDLASRLGWPVEVVTYAGSAAELIENALAPAQVHNVTVSQSGVAYAEVDRDDRGLAIGKGGARIRRARLLADQYYGVDDVELT
jgi:N utilization substance protein A